MFPESAARCSVTLFRDAARRIVPLIEALLYVARFGVSLSYASSPTLLLGIYQHLINTTTRSSEVQTVHISPQQPAAWATQPLTIGHKVDEFPSQMLTREPLAFDSGTLAVGKDDQRSPL